MSRARRTSASTAAVRAGVVRVPDVEARGRPSGDRIGGARLHVDRPDGRDQPRRGERVALHGGDPLGRAGEGVAALRHRRGPGMIRRAIEREVEAALPGDGFDHAHRQAQALEHRPLFDVEFEIRRPRGRRPCIGHLGWIQAVVGHRLAHATVPPRPGARAASASAVPASARLPMNGTPKRTPSSSENPTTSMANGNARRPSRPTSSTPSTTPSTPSNAPARRTVSRWEPM